MKTILYYQDSEVVTYTQGFGLDDGIDTLYTPLATTGNNTAIDNLRTLQFTAENTPGFSVFPLH
jgi:hypothetical protein